MTNGEPSKVSGDMKQAEGTIRENVGKVLGNDEMRAKGVAKNQEGHAEHDAAQAKGWLEGASDSVIGTLKNTIGTLTGNNEQEAKGKVQQEKGDAKKAANS